MFLLFIFIIYFYYLFIYLNIIVVVQRLLQLRPKPPLLQSLLKEMMIWYLLRDQQKLS